MQLLMPRLSYLHMVKTFLHGKSLTELENTAINTSNQLSHWMDVCKLQCIW